MGNLSTLLYCKPTTVLNNEVLQKREKNRHMKKLAEGLWEFYPGEEKLTYLCKIKSSM